MQTTPPSTMAATARGAKPAAPGSDVDHRLGENLAHLIKRAVVSIAHHADSRLAVRGLTSTQWTPLMKLLQGGPSAVVDLARGCRVDAGAMTRLLDRLEKKKLCKRSRSTADRRVVRIELTPAGEATAAEVQGVLAEVHDAHLAGFSVTERRALHAYLQRIARAGEAMRDTPERAT